MKSYKEDNLRCHINEGRVLINRGRVVHFGKFNKRGEFFGESNKRVVGFNKQGELENQTKVSNKQEEA